MQIDESTGLYFCSALLQANAALIAISWVIGIFKAQSINNRIQSLKQSALQHLKPFDEYSFYSKHIYEFEQANKARRDLIIKAFGSGPAHIIQHPARILEEWLLLQEGLRRMWRSIFNISACFLLMISLSGFGIIFATTIHHRYPNHEMWYLVGLMILNMLIPGMTGVSLRKLIEN